MGISLNGLTPAGTYPGLIKTGDNTAISGTPKVLSDGNGNNLPMEVSTAGVNLTGSPTVNSVAIANTTQVAAKQDTLVSGTNIKTINGTSVLGSGNIAVVTSPSGVAGAIQFSNGSAFASDAAQLFWDDTNNRLGVGTNTPTRNFQVNGIGAFINADGNTALYATNSNTGVSSVLHANCGSSNMYFGGFGLLTNSDSTFGQLTTLGARVGIRGSGSTSATTSLLVQNSGGGHLFSVRDDGRLLMGNNNVFGRLYSNIVGADFPSYSFDGNPQVGMFNISTGNFGLSAGGVERMRISTGGIGINTLASNVASATLQIDSTTQGVLFPRMTTTQKNAIASPATGLVLYDSTTNKLQCYNGSTWNDLF
jgi:hypothetical protein